MASKKEIIIETLKEEILSMTLQPGTVISEATLTERFSISRTPIRDILKQLSRDGYIDIFPQRGSVVSYIDLSSVEQIIYMRSTLESDIIKNLCGKLELTGIHKVRELISKQKECVELGLDLHTFLNYDDLFHQALYELAGRTMVWNILQQFTVHYSRYRRLHMLKASKQHSIIDAHQEIIDTIINDEPEKIDSLIHRHLRSDIKSHYFQENYSNFIKEANL